MSEVTTALRSLNSICKFNECEQKAELCKDDSELKVFRLKVRSGSKIVEKDYICHSYQAVKLNGYCYYHNRFITANVMREKSYQNKK